MCYFLSNFLETIGVNCSSYFPIHSPPSRHERFSHLTSSNRFPQFLPHRPPSLPRLDPFFPTKRRRLSARGAPRATRRLSESRPQAATQLQRAAPGLLWLRLGGANISKTSIGYFWTFMDTFGHFRNCWAVFTFFGNVGQFCAVPGGFGQCLAFLCSSGSCIWAIIEG